MQLELHPTFTPALVVLDAQCDEDQDGWLSITRTGWGTFVVPITCLLSDGSVVVTEFDLDFAKTSATVTIPLSRRRFV